MSKISQTLSYILRHGPQDFGLEMNSGGWVKVQPLVDALQINIPTLVGIVNSDDKGRYQFNQDASMIRATQGHSLSVLIDYPEYEGDLPELYHGTAIRFANTILSEGLKPMSRIYVHLSSDKETAVSVGSRHGSPILFSVDYKQMQKDGLKLYLSDNGVILTEHVPPQYIKVI